MGQSFTPISPVGLVRADHLNLTEKEIIDDLKKVALNAEILDRLKKRFFDLWKKSTGTDPAMVAIFDKGGIDLNSKNLNLKEQGQGTNFNFFLIR